MTEIQIGGAKRARRGYSLDEVAIAPSRRTRDPEAVSTALADRRLPVRHPAARRADGLGGLARQRRRRWPGLGVLAVLNLEGLWGRYEDAEPLLAEIAGLDAPAATPRLQELYAARPVDAGLVQRRIEELKAQGSHRRRRARRRREPLAWLPSPRSRASTSSSSAAPPCRPSTCRPTAVPLNLKQFIHELDAPVIVGGCATHQAALHLMRTGAAGVLVGFGGGASHTTADVMGVRVPMASAIADVAAARRDYLDESGGRYVHVIADGSMGRSGDIVKAIACGADAAMVGSLFARASDAPGRGAHWGAEAWHPHLPRGERHLMPHRRARSPRSCTVRRRSADGTMNVVGALRKAMATTGYSDVKEFQRVEMVVTA